MNEEPTLNDKLTLLAEKCPRIELLAPGEDYAGSKIFEWSVDRHKNYPIAIETQDGTDLFCRRVVRELEARGKCAMIIDSPNKPTLDVYEGECQHEILIGTFDQPNEIERYATALYEVICSPKGE